MSEVRTGDGRVLTDAEAAAHAGIVARLSWPSLHWGAEDLHADALPHIAIAAVAAATPLIREQVAAEIEAYAQTPGAMSAGAAFAGGLTRAARIARGTQ